MELMRILSGTIPGFSPAYGLGISGSLLDRIKERPVMTALLFGIQFLHNAGYVFKRLGIQLPCLCDKFV